MCKKRQNNIKDKIFKNDFWAIIVMFIIVLCQLFLSKDKTTIDPFIEFLKIIPIIFTCNRNRLRVKDTTQDKAINGTLEKLIRFQIFTLVIYLIIPVFVLFKGITIDNNGLIIFCTKISLLNKIRGITTTHYYYFISTFSQIINALVQLLFVVFNKEKDN